MSSARKSFLIHIDSLDVIDELDDEQAGKLLKAIKAYHKTEEIELDFTTKLVFAPFKSQFIRDDEKYQKIVERNKNNGLKGGRPKKDGNPEEPNKPSGLNGNPENPSKPDSDSDSDSDSDNKEPIDRFDYEAVVQVWNDSCSESITPSKKSRVVSEKLKKILPKAYEKYVKVKKSNGNKPSNRMDFCKAYFPLVLEWGQPWVGSSGPNESWKMNLEHAAKVDTYDKVVEWATSD